MEIESPQTEIASHLAQSLKRSFDAIGRSWKFQEPEVYKKTAEVIELADILQFIQELHIYDQHKQISNDCLDDWLWRFKDFFYKTENVLDDLDFIRFRNPHWAGNDKSSAFEVEEMHFMKAIAKLPEVIETAAGLLDEIKHFKKELQKSKPVCSSLDQQRNTSSGLRTLPSKVRELKGRAVEKAKILEALLHKAEGESKESLVMISITGPVGIGKTELARAVYNSAQVEAEFDVKAWIYMGNHPLDEWWLTLERSVSASVYKQSKIHRTSGSYSILETMKTEITGKKVLIVLDNLTGGFFNDLFKYGAKVGSRIIVTSQFRYVGNSDDLLFDVELDGLEEEEYLELFKECALGDRNRNKYPELEDIVGEIAKRFGGNPLAAVTIGRHLKWHQSEERWRMISRSSLGIIDPTEKLSL
ncbi:putative disease resistance protein RGA4 [Curcuma longa]|uniref:putative disease resistance protein RGA4 n=1 Tax=Curcuma longa TaxID=136217 RepID=UPI003D9DDEFD